MIRKPDWLVSFLNQLHWKIITWDIDIGTPIETTIDWVLEPVNAIAEWVAQAVAWWEEFRQEVVDFFNLVREWINQVIAFIDGIKDRIFALIGEWWLGVIDTIKGWIEIARQFVIDLIDILQVTVNRVVTAWDNFWTDILPGLASKLDVSDLINNALLPFRNLLNWFEQVKTDLGEFFANPWEWLWSKFADWFLGGE